MPAWFFDDVSRAVALAVALALLCGVVIVSLVFISRALSDVSSVNRKIHQQQANIIAMLLRAGFRPARGKDWFDDGDYTRVKGELDYTNIEFKAPDQ